jgi:hypothetical protein
MRFRNNGVCDNLVIFNDKSVFVDVEIQLSHLHRNEC